MLDLLDHLFSSFNPPLVTALVTYAIPCFLILHANALNRKLKKAYYWSEADADTTQRDITSNNIAIVIGFIWIFSQSGIIFWISFFGPIE